MKSGVLSVLFLVTVFVGCTVAVAPCRKDLVEGFSQHKECYTNGKAPNQQAGAGLATYVVASKGVIPDNATCQTGSQDTYHAYGKIFYKDNSTESWTYKMVHNDTFIEETDDKGIKYKLYVIIYEKAVYTYYRCIEEGSPGTGSDSVVVAVGCAYVNNPDSKAVVDRSKKCFDLLGIKNYVNINPCKC